MTRLADTPPDTTLMRLFDRELRAGEAVSFALAGGVPLFETGEAADQLYVVRTGRLAAIRRGEGREPRLLGLIRPGEPAGEMSLIAGAPHSADVVALRDSEILALPRAAFFRAVERDPGLMIELTRLLLARARETSGKLVLADPTVFGFVGVEGLARVRPFVERIATAVRAMGYSVTVVDSGARDAPTEWFSNIEHMHDFVLYSAEAEEAGWKPFAARQVDRLFRIARGRDAPGPSAGVENEALHRQGLVDLILLQSADCAAPRGSAAWTQALTPARLFHIRERDRADLERLARLITGQSVGLVLSGGAARAYAHVGAIQAMRERRIPIDFIGGVSMGAVIGAGVAMGWDDEELERRIRKAFVESSPVDDITFPMIAMTGGRTVQTRLAEHFGDREIRDLWLPFFCGSANLTTGAYQVHRDGLLREALRASLSLPGVLPPVTWRGDVLVDGAVMNNFPTDIMRSANRGPIVGVDVSRGRSIDADDIKPPASIWRWLVSGDWKRGPPIVSLLMRAATVTTGRDLAAARDATDVLILPNVSAIEIRDWKAFSPAVAAGRAAAFEAFDKLTGPVSELRRRPAMDTAGPSSDAPSPVPIARLAVDPA